MSKFKEEQQKTDDYSIGWKRHDEFFRSLNTKLDEISYIGELCYRDKTKVYEYFAKVRNLFNKHKVYLRDSNSKRDLLLKIEQSLYNPSFIKDMKVGRVEANTHIHTIFMQLQDLLSDMVDDFSAPELIPKPVKHEVEPWEEETDAKKKVMYKTAVLMFKNV